MSTTAKGPRCNKEQHLKRRNTCHQTQSEAITGFIRGRDVHLMLMFPCTVTSMVPVLYTATRAVFFLTLPYNVVMPMSLKIVQHYLFTVTPLRALAPGFKFTPFGLIDTYNAGGAIEGLKY